jgi:hypothetical protein
LTNSQTWVQAWNQSNSTFVAVIWEDYCSTFVQSNPDFLKSMHIAAQRMLLCVDWVYSNHENNVAYFKEIFSEKKISYLPFSIDFSVYDDKSFYRKNSNLFFKGKTDNFGFEVGPYQSRINLIHFLRARYGNFFVTSDGYVTDQEFASLLVNYKYHINLPSFSFQTSKHHMGLLNLNLYLLDNQF